MTYATHTTTIGTSFGQRLADVRASIATRMAKARMYRKTVDELQSLSNRDLADLGIGRSEIKSIALQAAYDV